MENIVIIRNRIIQNNGSMWSTTVNQNLSVINLDDKLKITVYGIQRKDEVIEYLISKNYLIHKIIDKGNNIYSFECTKAI